jgi:large subunit GTPase 1
MVMPKSKKSVGLGNSLMNDRFGKGKGADMRKGNFNGQGIERTGQMGEKVRSTIHTDRCLWIAMRAL